MTEKLLFNNLGQWDLNKSDDWMVGNDFSDRDSMPKMKGDQRDSALKDLGSKTQSRTNKETGKKEFLLHRGVGEQEGWAHDDNSIDDVTSWTPHHHVAHQFSKQYNSTDSSRVHQDRTISAWIPEDSVHAIPAHNIDKDHDFHYQLKQEHEVVVAPHKFNYASPDERKAAHSASKKSKLI